MKKFFTILWLLYGVHSSAIPVQPSLRFIENRGQGMGDFYSPAPAGWVGVKAGELNFYLFDKKQMERQHEWITRGMTENGLPLLNEPLHGHYIKCAFIGASASKPIATQPFPDYYNYFLGNDTSQWKSKVPAYQQLEYKNLYAGIHWMVTSQDTNLKYEFHVQPRANPSIIVWEYDGADGIYINEQGDLIVKNSFGTHAELKPLCYQWCEGQKIYIRAHYELTANRVRIILEEPYDIQDVLVIDPLLIFSTYSGSTADNWGSSATPGEKGNLYSSGIVRHVTPNYGLPVTTGAFQSQFGGGSMDIAILKYDSTGQHLLYASYLGGSAVETPHSLVVNAQHELLVFGSTSSDDYPVTINAVQKVFKGGVAHINHVVAELYATDMIISKISADGSVLVASTFLGGTDNDGINPEKSPLVQNYGDQFRGDIVTSGDKIYIASVTSSTDFPASGFSSTFKGGFTDAVIICLSMDLSTVKWANFIGGSEEDASHSIQIDKDGNLFVAGGTASSDFPTTAGVYQTTLAGAADGWMAHLKKDGTGIISATLTGTPQFDQVYFIDIDEEGSVFVYGQTAGLFPITVGVYNNPRSGQFLQKFDSQLTKLKFSTVIGSGIGTPNISPTDFLVNECGLIYLAGWGGMINSAQGYWLSDTKQMPTTSDAYQSSTSGSDFYFCALSSDATQLLYATFLGGSQSRTHIDGGTCRFDKAGIVYHAVCSGCSSLNVIRRSTSDFPTTPNAFSRVNRSSNCNNAAFKFDLSLLKAKIQTNTIDKKNPHKTSFCLDDTVLFENMSFGGVEYRWTIDGATQVLTTKESVTYKFTKAGSYPIQLKAIDKGSCRVESMATTTIIVNNPAGRVGNDKVICEGQSTTLDAYGGVEYLWTTPQQDEVYTQRVQAVNPTKNKVYHVVITDVNGCVAEGEMKVRVIPTIHLKWTIEYQHACAGMVQIHFHNQSDSIKHTYIEMDDGTTSNKADFWYSYPKEGIYLAKLIGKDESCANQLQENIWVYQLKVPNVITPGEDKLNDTFQIQAMGSPAYHIVKVSITIANRYGKEVYTSDNYQNDWGGEGVAGIYYYTIRINDQVTCKGWVQVIY